MEDLAFAREETVEAVDIAGKGGHQRTGLVVEPDGVGEEVEQGFAIIRIEGGRDVHPTGKDLFDGVIDEGAERFHDVISEAKGIIAFVVKDAKRWLESGGDEGSCSSRADDGVAIVEEAIEVRFALGVAFVTCAVAVGEQCRPVDAGGLGFVVFGIAGFNGLGEGEDFFTKGIVDELGLGADFGLDDRFPGLFTGGKVGTELGHHAGDEFGVGEGREKKSGGKVFVVADDDDGSGFKEGMEDGGGEGDGGVLEDEDADVFAGEGAFAFIVGELDDQLPMAQGEADGALGDFEGVFEQSFP